MRVRTELVLEQLVSRVLGRALELRSDGLPADGGGAARIAARSRVSWPGSAMRARIAETEMFEPARSADARADRDARRAHRDPSGGRSAAIAAICGELAADGARREAGSGRGKLARARVPAATSATSSPWPRRTSSCMGTRTASPDRTRALLRRGQALLPLRLLRPLLRRGFCRCLGWTRSSCSPSSRSLSSWRAISSPIISWSSASTGSWPSGAGALIAAFGSGPVCDR